MSYGSISPSISVIGYSSGQVYLRTFNPLTKALQNPKINSVFPLPFGPDIKLMLFSLNNLSIKNLDIIANNHSVDIREILQSFNITQPSVVPEKDKHLFKQNIFYK